MTAVPLRLIDDIGMRKLTSAAAKDLMEDHLTHYAVRNIPKLTVSKQLRKPPTQHDPSKNYQFRYRAKRHSTLPHVVKFSGGRSSGMLLFTLLENKILNADRGDVILFNNTSAEHPDTYRFAQDCNKASNRYGIPSFWVEFQTYEDARNGEWTRLPSYRLVNDQPKRLGRAIAAIAMQRTPIDWVTGDTLDASTIRTLEDTGNLDRHHVFPKEFLKAHSNTEEINHGLNGVLLTKGSNRALSNKDPVRYLQWILKETKHLSETELRGRCESHLVPYDALKSAGTTKNRYKNFLKERAQLVADEIAAVAGQSISRTLDR